MSDSPVNEPSNEPSNESGSAPANEPVSEPVSEPGNEPAPSTSTQSPAEAEFRASNNVAESRYELDVNGVLAVIAVYREVPGAVDFVHTETMPGVEGRGLAARLVGYALDDVVASGKRIIPHCPYVARFVAKHPDAYLRYSDFPEETF